MVLEPSQLPTTPTLVVRRAASRSTTIFVRAGPGAIELEPMGDVPMPERAKAIATTNALQTAGGTSIEATVDHLTAGLTRYLADLGLPTDAVLVAPTERMRVLSNVPSVAADLSAAQRARAYYMSKFIAACGVGLFDAALNFLWNETISNLREKVARFDLVYFLDSVVTDSKRRSAFRSADDLNKLEDWELIRGCLDTGIISEIGYKHLDYIRDMRNHASAAHPNQNQLTGLQVVSWLETCIKEVLSKEPEGGVIEVRKLLHSLRTESLVAGDAGPIADSLARLPDDLTRSLLRAIFGMFTDVATAATTRNNILLIGQPLWAVCSDESRYEAGIKHETFAVNGEAARRSLAHQFLEAVDGLSYLPPNALAVEIERAVADLWRVHNGFNNFRNEPAYARLLAQRIPPTGRIAVGVEREYVKVLLMARIGNGYGVSIEAEPIYEDLISRWSERHMILFVRLIAEDREVASRLQLSLCAGNVKLLAGTLQARAANRLVQHALELIAGTPDEQVARLRDRSDFKQAVAAIAGQ